ncbi:ATP-binding cassette subfamily G member 4-like [Adelges cooleyi]|uniref:ATP-binding cassette subfamily G member 4-like n=1 Tax=Adelges cooleyi TaxID=133065 RepID=UPI00217FCEC5|nr:ATP-binding cassette subfamily G member 4-like [Adelges cooleyi]XP_050422488.1 ATP-binding cassette subfamily G member 4-like [Adelges cooleyi]
MDTLDDLENGKSQHHMLKRPPVDIEFTDLTYSVPQGRNGSKFILRSVSGLFRSGELTAILGPSGAGKSTLINVLAGYRCADARGSIMVNSRPRDMRTFRKMSRYIMQEDLLQPSLTVQESMEIASDLKLGYTISKEDKLNSIDEILQMLRLSKAKNTLMDNLSGGERKRLSVALELVNNPPVIFLDEPTTGLDDLSSSQCVALLKELASGGRTIVCSIHTPSAKLFAMFDHVYIVSEGQCVFTGDGQDIVQYLSTVGLNCPKHYNPADFMIEVCSREYGDYTDKLTAAVDNGKCLRWYKDDSECRKPLVRRASQYDTVSKHLYDFSTSGTTQFKILLRRMAIQHKRAYAFLLLKFVMYAFIGLMVGSMFFHFGNDASATIFNYGFIFITVIVFMYTPLMPVLLKFPSEVQLLKREYFNRWYGLNAYFCALTCSQFPMQILLSSVYIAITYCLTDQPLEMSRVIKFSVVCLLVSLSSESMAYAISSQFSVTNSVFLGPCTACPMMLLASFGLGYNEDEIPTLIRLGMSLSYLRYGVEALVMSVYGDGRGRLICPPNEDYCELRDPSALFKTVGMTNVNYWVSLTALFSMFVMFKVASYVMLRWRLSSKPSILLRLGFIGRLIKSHFNIPR